MACEVSDLSFYQTTKLIESFLTVLLCFSLICPCILKPKDGSVELQKVNDFNRAYQVRAPAFSFRLIWSESQTHVFFFGIQHAMRQLIDSGRYDTHENFTVVLQPFMRDINLPSLEVRADTPETFLLVPWNVNIHPHGFPFKGWSSRSLILCPWLFPSEPESSHSHGSRSLEQHGGCPAFLFC